MALRVATSDTVVRCKTEYDFLLKRRFWRVDETVGALMPLTFTAPPILCPDVFILALCVVIPGAVSRLGLVW